MDYNMAVFQKYTFGRLMTSCPHAHNAFKNRYVHLGFRWPMDHVSVFLTRYLDQLKPLLRKPLNCTVTYHDSCCIGRQNDFYEEPRNLVRAIPGVRLVEMTHNRVNAICCGGGGGGMWLDTYFKTKGYERLSERRVREAVASGADVLAVTCPYEVSRFEDALKVLGYDKRMVVRDITELLAESMEG
jgi:dimethylglycine catabolism B